MAKMTGKQGLKSAPHSAKPVGESAAEDFAEKLPAFVFGGLQAQIQWQLICRYLDENFSPEILRIR